MYSIYAAISMSDACLNIVIGGNIKCTYLLYLTSLLVCCRHLIVISTYSSKRLTQIFNCLYIIYIYNILYIYLYYCDYRETFMRQLGDIREVSR